MIFVISFRQAAKMAFAISPNYKVAMVRIGGVWIMKVLP